MDVDGIGSGLNVDAGVDVELNVDAGVDVRLNVDVDGIGAGVDVELNVDAGVDVDVEVYVVVMLGVIVRDILYTCMCGIFFSIFIVCLIFF